MDACSLLLQVHRARLADGREVAVKVQYPGLARAVAADLMTLRLLARLARDAPSGGGAPSSSSDGGDDASDESGIPDLSWVVAQLERNLARELDFVAEGRNAERVAAAFAAFGASGGGTGAVATAPAVVWERSSRRVLTMAWQEGCRVDDAAALRAAGLDTADVARALVDAVGQMAFCFGAPCRMLEACRDIISRSDAHIVAGFVHGDLHPGNIRVVAAPPAPRGFLARLLRLPSARARPQLVLLDHGLYAELDEASRLAYCALWRAVALGDAAAAVAAGSALVAGTSEQWSLMTLRPEALSKGERAAARSAARLRSAADVAEFLSGVPPALGVAFRAQGLLRAVTLQLGLTRGERMRRTLDAAATGAACRGGAMPAGVAARARLAASRVADRCRFAFRVVLFSAQMLAARMRGSMEPQTQ
jgi:aarF domain-containing kinase